MNSNYPTPIYVQPLLRKVNMQCRYIQVSEKTIETQRLKDTKKFENPLSYKIIGAAIEG